MAGDIRKFTTVKVRSGQMGILSRVLDVDVDRKGGTSRFVKIPGSPVRWMVRKV